MAFRHVEVALHTDLVMLARLSQVSPERGPFRSRLRTHF